MIRTIRHNDRDVLDGFLERLEARAVAFDPELMRAVSTIVDDVRARGDEALIDYSARFDGLKLTPADMRIDEGTLNASADNVDRRVLAALRGAIKNVRAFHEHQVERSWEIAPADGVRIGQRITPLDSVGLYVPGGTAAYPSSVVMN